MQFCQSDKTYLERIRYEHIPNVPPYTVIKKAYNHLNSGRSNGFLVTEKKEPTSERISLDRVRLWFVNGQSIDAAIAQSLEITANDDAKVTCKSVAENTDNNDKPDESERITVDRVKFWRESDKIGENREMNQVEKAAHGDTQMDNTQITKSTLSHRKIDVLKIKLPKQAVSVVSGLPELPVLSPLDTPNVGLKQQERYSREQNQFLNSIYSETKSAVPCSEKLNEMMGELNKMYEVITNGEVLFKNQRFNLTEVYRYGKQIKEVGQIKSWFYNKRLTDRKNGKRHILPSTDSFDFTPSTSKSAKISNPDLQCVQNFHF